MSSVTWRERAKAVIYPAMLEGKQKGLTGRALRRFINKRYPFGVRAHFPYKVWLDELSIALENPLAKPVDAPGTRQLGLGLFDEGQKARNRESAGR